MSEIRLDKVHNQYVIIAPERLQRPNMSEKSYTARTYGSCPFCNGHEDLTPPEVFAIRENESNAQGWKTRVIPNLYKAVQVELDNVSERNGMFESMAGTGAHEILIDSPCHDCGMNDLSQESIANWLRSLIIRIDDLSKDKRLVYFSIFKNSGINAGATQNHPHTQILALPLMPSNELSFLQRNLAYYQLHGRGLVQDIVYNEQRDTQRVIQIIGNFVAYCPYASAFPFEVMIAPTTKISNLNRCTRAEVSDLAMLVKKVFQMLSEQLGKFDYNLSFQLPPLNSNFENESFMSSLEDNFTFNIRITPRIYTLAGFEIATGMAINSVEPEECAKLLRGDI